MTDEKLQQDELQAEKDFDAGFTDQPSEAPAAKAAEPETPAEQATETPAEQPVEEFVQIKRGDFDKLMAAAEKTASLEQQMSKAFGSIGNLKQMVEAQPKAVAPVVGNVTLSDEDFAELKADFPELAESTKKAVQRALSKIGVSGAEGSNLSKADIERTLVELQTQKSVNFLDDAHPQWRDIVGRPDDPECEFRNWLKTKSSTYQKRINTTNDGFEIATAIESFNEAREAKKKAEAAAKNKTAQDPKQDERRRVIASAVLPKGDGGPAAPRKSAEDWFNEGFQSR